MATRLGNVLYWFFGFVGGLFLIGAILFVINRDISVPFPYINYAFRAQYLDHTSFEIAFTLIAIINYLIGRACRYVLAGN